MKAKDMAKGKWKSLLPRLGIPPEFLDGRHHPCPKGSGKDRFRFTDRNGSGSYFCDCSQGASGGMSLLMCCKDLSYHQACIEVEKVVGDLQPERAKPARDPRPALNRVRELCNPVGFAVSRYLKERGLRPAPNLKQARLQYWDKSRCLGAYDTMVGLIQSATGKPQSYHLTYLDGIAKANVPSPRKVMTPVETITGAAIRLYPIESHIGIAEGIETAIAAHLLLGMPVWSVINAHGIETFMPPDGVKHVTVFGDKDDSCTGEAAAYACAKRLKRAGFDCDVQVPDAGDWNDVLLRRAS